MYRGANAVNLTLRSSVPLLVLLFSMYIMVGRIDLTEPTQKLGPPAGPEPGSLGWVGSVSLWVVSAKTFFFENGL